MTNCVVITKTSLRPDPDDTSAEVMGLDIGHEVVVLRELKPWTKVSVASTGAQTYLGWVHSDALKENQTKPIHLYDQPEGEGTTVIGDIVGVRLRLPPWSKADVRLADGRVTTGWISSAEPGSGTPDPAAAGLQPGGNLVLGPNEIYRSFLIEAEIRTEIDAAAIAALINAEAAKLPNGQWNKDSQAGTSSAAGLTQFLASTWLGEAKKAQTLLNECGRAKGLLTAANAIVAGREAELLALRFDPRLSIVAAAEYGLFNLNALIKTGIVADEIGDDEKARFIYLAHHEGLGGAQAFLKGTKVYSFSDFATQVGQSKAQALVNAANGNTTLAYRTWLNGYLDRNIQPSRYRKRLEIGPSSSGEGTKALELFDGPPLLITNLSSNGALAKAIQWRLSELGYLDPPADGMFGPVSAWALSEFCEGNGVSLRDGFTRAVAQRLLAPAALLPDITQSGTWLDKVIAYMNAKFYFICRHPECKNIVYLEGVDPDGTLNNDASNRFNDLRIVFTIGADGRPNLDGSIWDSTTEPGRFWTMNPMNAKGAARIAFNQYKAWVVGTHHPNTPSAHEALVQAEPISVYRDLNKDFKRTGDQLDTGLFAINQHWGYDASKDDLGRTSAGCLVGRTRDGHRKFMALVKDDPRYKTNHSYRFITAVMPGDEVLK
ncbi:Putative peptidoglycan binding domain-containing protein [Methylobacterium sp. 275MFSha3.1]|uniref:peptidoglycan-binding domain-containing protein n=1 Tax=Methylobacterium sp. 275MFSha3.1 TaxID=1502746 RepID=UPI0008A7C804|nr:peptidoglycan-binding domain-containing protein [Methylobacterium sp. 275MFSha3.1]SEI01823.1 Putative peptidoglycan binding domain-containing protein [Methylobacterium sp. 275MFSha3.1]